MRGLVHVAAVLGLAAVAVGFGRWLREAEPGGPLLVLLAAVLACALALRRLYRPGGLGRARAAGRAAAPPAAPAAAAPPAPADERIDLNAASVADLRRLPGIGPVGAERIVAERERNGPYRSVGDLARVAGFGPSRVRGLVGRIRVG